MKPRKAFPLRIDPELYRELEAWAQQEFRSVNGQIEFLLRDAVNRRRGRHPSESDPSRHADRTSADPT
ncbi:MAG: toxin-antitoxin system HicB family antitoxin [Planctomycetes bacterium]|nr:toxin-antitoxin system HicB family antitoxin [Planctomycetota bacterium]